MPGYRPWRRGEWPRRWCGRPGRPSVARRGGARRGDGCRRSRGTAGSNRLGCCAETAGGSRRRDDGIRRTGEAVIKRWCDAVGARERGPPCAPPKPPGPRHRIARGNGPPTEPAVLCGITRVPGVVGPPPRTTREPRVTFVSCCAGARIRIRHVLWRVTGVYCCGGARIRIRHVTTTVSQNWHNADRCACQRVRATWSAAVRARLGSTASAPSGALVI